MTAFLAGFLGLPTMFPARLCSNPHVRRVSAFLLAGPLCSLVLAASAGAAAPAPGWTIESFPAPSSFSSEHNAGCLATFENQAPACDSYEVTARNAGSEPTDGSEVVIGDTLPAGLAVKQLRFDNVALPPPGPGEQCEETISPTATVVRCHFAPGPVAADQELKLTILLTVSDPTARTLHNDALVEGGGAAAAETTSSNQVGEPAAFGFSSFDFYAAALNGERDTQAADHPYELTVSFGLNTTLRRGPEGGNVQLDVPQDVRDFVTDLPLGFVGSVLAAPQCTFAQLTSHISGGVTGCPPETVIGHLRTEPEAATAINAPIYNMTPEQGFPAEFAYADETGGTHAFYTRVVPTPKGYVLRVTNPEIPAIPLKTILATFYGVPAQKDGTGNLRVPFFTNPTDCSGEEPTATMYMDSWQNPARFNPDGTPVDLEEPQWAKAQSKSPPVTGCNALQFTPELLTKPTTQAADTPSGMDVGLTVPQSETPGVPATPTLRTASVTFPQGVTLDPSAGGGLEACSEAQIGWLGADGPHGEALPNRGLTNFNAAEPACPEGSKVGSLELTTPLIAGTLHGEMYLAAQNENPYGSEIGLYVVVQDPVTGVLVKIAGRTLSDPATGQITGIFEENPNLPFSELRLSFFGGPRAEFATPNDCGTYTTTSALSPWSLEGSQLPATPFSSFPISTGCVSGFAPAFTGSSLNVQAGAYSPFVASFSREDTDRELAGLSVSLPPGLLAHVAGVPLCGEAQANAGTCPESTRVGSVLAEAGPGPNPLPDNGRVYLTGPYNGGPYGLSVVVPAIAGPFDFGLVVVRQSLRIDPHTAQVTDVSDPFPVMLHATGADGQSIGIPIRLRRVQVSIDRPGFTFNPTNCSRLHVGAAITSTRGEAGALETPFQVTDCASLRFTPKVAVSTAARASKVDGASLHFRIAYPKGAMGTQAWFNEAKFDLPKQLPARLTTIQKACLAKVFETERQNCPPASRIGHVVVHTQVLPTPLEGPVYFVSYGGAAFPDAVLVLDGSGVHIELHGNTFINSKTGVTSATFLNTPDVPFESIEVTIPQGPFSEFGANLPAKANYSFCGQKLVMPTFFKASNGLDIHQNTPVTVTGCPKTKTRAQKLAAALKACHKKHGRKRAACERAARRAYGAKVSKKARRR